ncbi:SH3 domain-containing protein 19-like [Xiphophorus maculatus]|uniref:SH3 domain-containing protein 19-like n=1 Tax=Xiphophorus maculatus TaxID=8083 RepID=M3ZZ23_XIPMA|nr:SH3 domain-containing protein 19-like [Xiphophorus maculatus]
MAEARSEEEEENLRRDTRDQVVRRQPNSSGGRPDRRKPEHRHSQGPLSSIRAVIKRTSRSTSVSETHRERDRERDRDRRRPEITILAAEPLPSTSWFPGAVGGIPPPPPPPAQIWGPTIAPTIQPPPSYEEVIREKTQEQVLHPPPASSSSPLVCRTTIATQTDPGPAADPQETRDRRSARPPRPPPPTCTSRPPNAADVITSSQSTVSSSEANSVATNAHPEPQTHTSTHTQCSDFLSDQQLPSALPDPSPDVPLERPRPRPRTRLARQPVSDEVKVQTLVKLREDGLATLAARAAGDSTNPEGSNGKYLQELLEAFSSDDWGFPDHCSDDSERSQSESEDGAEEEDMATLRARIQAFEQQVADESCGDFNTGNVEGFTVTKRPEPRPRPRLQGQPAKSTPPVIAPKPKSFSPSPKPSSKVFWEDEGVAVESGSVETAESNPEAPSSAEASKSDPVSDIKPSQTPEKPAITPKPQTVTEPLPSSAPVPAPRPPPPKLTSSISSDSFPPNPGPPKRPPVAPRASLGAPPRSGGEATQNTVTQTVKGGSIRSTVKPAAPTSPRRASAPSLAPKPTAVPPACPDPNPVPLKPAAVGPAAPTKPPGPPKPPTPAPAPAMRKASVPQAKAEASIPANSVSSGPTLPQRPPSVKLLPLRPPPIKSAPSRPPPPAINSSTNQIAAAKAVPAEQFSSANQMQTQRVSKKGPPLPPRPKPGHPLYNSYVKEEVLIVLDNPKPAPADSQQAGEGTDQSSVTADISPSQCLLDLDTQPETVQHQDGESKTAIEDLNQSDFQSILPVQPAELKEQPDPPAVSGPRCVALFDYEGEDDDELTFSQGDVIGLLELVGEEWGRGQIHGRTGIFPLNFMEVVEPLPEPTPGETSKQEAAETGETESSATLKQPSELKTDEWVMALFDFPGQTADDLSFQKGALIQVTEHVDAEWRRGRLDGREGLFPAAFTQPSQAQPITGQQSAAKGTAKAVFDFTAESEDELTLKVGDILTQVEPVDEQWILGVVGGKRGIVPKNYISFL